MPSDPPPAHPAARRTARLLLRGLAAADLSAIATLHTLGRVSWASVEWTAVSTWTSVSPEVVLTAGLRHLALGAAYWVAAALALHAATAGRAPPLGRHWATLPAIRRLVEGTAAVAMATSTLVGSRAAVATEPPPIPVVVEAPAGPPAPDPGPEPVAGRPLNAGPPEAPGPWAWLPAPGQVPGSTPDRAAPAPPRPDRAGPSTYVVRPGDNLWTISAAHLAATGFVTDEPAVATYWAEVIAANLGQIRSGDPDLIYPGELVVLPEVPA